MHSAVCANLTLPLDTAVLCLTIYNVSVSLDMTPIQCYFWV